MLIAEGVILGVLSSLFVEFYTLETNKLPDKTPEVYLKQVYVNNVCGVILLLVGAFATSELTELQFLPIAPTCPRLLQQWLREMQDAWMIRKAEEIQKYVDRNRLNGHLKQGLFSESQCRFRRHRGTTDMIFAASRIQEKCQM
ncbi:unnamed protein product [Schistocephalus solidus]|uniref:Uncharacterized protein n=1 Tax=Schistocephalus solidus TaxID=70667 RepID=A0A3P7DPD2_SCHSO|nr:unnamed protein product [Schistocephalus solidus]